MEFYVGSYAHKGSKSIKKIEFCPDKGIFTETGALRESECPSYVYEDRANGYLYAVRELTEEGAVYLYSLEDGRLLEEHGGLGKDPCFISVSTSGRFLFAVSYTGGSIAVFRINGKCRRDGERLELVQTVKNEGKLGPVSSRQESSHPHCAFVRPWKYTEKADLIGENEQPLLKKYNENEAEDRFTEQGIPESPRDEIFVCNLGLDCVFVYQLDEENSRLELAYKIQMPAGTGPRHVLFSAKDPQLVYIVGELANTVNVVRIPKRGYKREGSDPDPDMEAVALPERGYKCECRILQTISTISSDFEDVTTAAAIRMSGDGNSLYVSNRGEDTIAAFAIREDGLLEAAGRCSCGGKVPRDFDICGDFIIAANQESGSVNLIKLEGGGREMTLTDICLKTEKPTSVFIIR